MLDSVWGISSTSPCLRVREELKEQEIVTGLGLGMYPPATKGWDQQVRPGV
jgi:hypothetical protein